MKKIASQYYKIFFWTFFGVFSLGQLQRIELSSLFAFLPSSAIYIHELLMVFFVFSQIKNIISQIQSLTQKNSICNSNHRLLYTFIFWVLVSTVVSLIISFDLISILYVARLCLYLIFSILVYQLIKQKKINLNYFHFQLFSVGIFTLLLGYLQYLFIPDTRFLSIFGWDDHYARLIGSFFDPGFTGLILIISTLLGLSHQYLKKVKLPLLFIFGIGIALTFSRASYLALLLAILMVIVQKATSFKKIFYQLGSILIIFFLLILVIPKPFGEGVDLLRSASVQARTQAISKQISTIDAKTLLIGNGLFAEIPTNSKSDHPASYLLPSHSRIPDNMFLTVLLYTGLPGLILFLAILFKYTMHFYKTKPYLTAAIVAFIIHGQFNNSLLQPFTQLLLLLSIAVLIHLRNQRHT